MKNVEIRYLNLPVERCIYIYIFPTPVSSANNNLQSIFLNCLNVVLRWRNDLNQIVLLEKIYNFIVDYINSHLKSFRACKFYLKCNNCDINILMNFSNELCQICHTRRYLEHFCSNCLNSNLFAVSNVHYNIY